MSCTRYKSYRRSAGRRIGHANCVWAASVAAVASCPGVGVGNHCLAPGRPPGDVNSVSYAHLDALTIAKSGRCLCAARARRPHRHAGLRRTAHAARPQVQRTHRERHLATLAARAAPRHARPHLHFLVTQAKSLNSQHPKPCSQPDTPVAMA